jgi:hypothetical protein
VQLCIDLAAIEMVWLAGLILLQAVDRLMEIVKVTQRRPNRGLRVRR